MDYVGILTHFSLAAPQANKQKIDTKTGANRLEYYAVIAFPPEAGPALLALLTDQANASFGGLHSDVQHGVKENRYNKKGAIAGIPHDWLLVRAASEYAPYIANEAGVQLTPDAIRSAFYAGKKVRASLSTYRWTHPSNGRGVSMNLAGVMAAGDGERLNIGTGVVANGFAKYGNPNAGAPSSAQTNPGSFGGPQAGQQGNPFGGHAEPHGQHAGAAAGGFAQPGGFAANGGAHTQTLAQPGGQGFGQPQHGQGGNPFAQPQRGQGGQGGNPFAQPGA